ncbi:hypothetical protein [Anaerosphaera multitolerans]|uniref:hypothetical protein n=1 Tax=Anaerosphaera multitolerans TaxID=2487351 RepID=UPI0013E2A04D|nr:hypothetical protein [Anaerosphaera multitolerans]
MKKKERIQTSFKLDAQVLKELKIYCINHNTTMQKLIEDYIVNLLKEEGNQQLSMFKS